MSSSPSLGPIVLCALAYVAGSIPFGLFVARVKGVDLRAVGSGNIGATNVARALGKGWAIFVLLLDAAKGFAPVALGRRLGVPPEAVALAGLAAIVGHMFTVFLRGRGGKGVATSLGVALALSPLAALCGFGLYVVAYAVTRLSSVGSLLGIWSFPVFATLLGGLARPYLVLATVVAILVTLRHRENIRRLIRGEEKRA
jgi:glycerol-3-phosphate acyltransferase PlsY